MTRFASLRRLLAPAVLVGLLASGAAAQSSDDASSVPVGPSGQTFEPGELFGGATDILFTNGGLATGTTAESGTAVPAAPAGYQWSEVQHDAGNTTVANTSAGAACVVALTNNFRLADDFTVPAGATWSVTSVSGYAHQTGYTGAASPFTSATLRIWNGPPDNPASTVVFGDVTTNRLSASAEAGLYRIFNSVVPGTSSPPGTTRRIWRNTMSLPSTLALTAGRYWVDYSFDAAAPGFCPAVTVPGARGLPGWNALQFTGTTSTWAAVVDVGNPVTGTPVPQDFPFEVAGTSSSATVRTASVCSTTAMTIPGTGGPPGPASLYPSTIVVSGVTGPVTDVDVRLIGLSHTFPADLDIFVEHPLGPTVILMSDVGGSSDISAISLTLDSDAAAELPNLLTSGTYRPTNLVAGDTWPAPAPVPSGNTLLSAFDGANPNGTWRLFTFDDGASDGGSMLGWCVDIKTGGPTAGETDADASVVSLVAAPNPSSASTQVRLTADAAQTVRVAVYDAVGRQVATLYDGPVAAGAATSLALDTSRLPAGVYLVRAVGETFVQTARIAVVR